MRHDIKQGAVQHMIRLKLHYLHSVQYTLPSSGHPVRTRSSRRGPFLIVLQAPRGPAITLQLGY
eukprot:8656992-Ditylum_brightwellii.AAC.1